jgi:arylsulfatase A-like enzyme
MYRPEKITLPDNFANRLPLPVQRLRKQLAQRTAKRAHQLAFAVSEQKARAVIALTLGLINFFDDQIGRLIENLKATREYENTIVVFNSDHGETLATTG